MAHIRPLVSVFDPEHPDKITGTVSTPGVFSTPIRMDIVQFVHSNISKNHRQAHGVFKEAGMQHSAESWHPGRAVARIPRVGGSGTSRSGQGAFGNMCRKGRMFAPLKTWRRWHRKVNVTQKRHAVAAALAASFQTPLVIARGHKVDTVRELPLILDDKIESFEKTKQVVSFLKAFGLDQDVERVAKSKTLRAGRGKIRNRRHRIRRGPLFIYSNENVKLLQAVRNIPGIETSNVHRLNLKQLAPGGTLGRLIVWTKSAFQSLDKIFGTSRKHGVEKKNYSLHRTCLSNADISRIINSDEIQSVVKPIKHHDYVQGQKKNPLKNKKQANWLNPHFSVVAKTIKIREEEGKKKRQASIDKKRVVSAEEKKTLKDSRKRSVGWISTVRKQLDDATLKANVKSLANH